MNYDFNRFNDFTGGRYRPNTGKPPHMTQDEWDQVLFQREVEKTAQYFGSNLKTDEYGNVLDDQFGGSPNNKSRMWHNKYKGEKQIDFNKLNWKPVYHKQLIVMLIRKENATSDRIKEVSFISRETNEEALFSVERCMHLMQWLDFPKASDPGLKHKLEMIFDTVLNNALFPYPVEELV